MHEVDARHVLVGHFRVDAHHFGMIEGSDEGQHMAGGWVIHIRTRFVGLGFQCKFQAILLFKHIFTQKVYSFAGAFDRIQRILACVCFGPFSSTPKYIDFCSEFHAQVDGVHRLLESVRTHVRVVGCKCTILEHRIAEQVGGCHRHNQSGFL